MMSNLDLLGSILDIDTAIKHPEMTIGVWLEVNKEIWTFLYHREKKYVKNCNLLQNRVKFDLLGSILGLDWLSRAPKGSFYDMVECEN